MPDVSWDAEALAVARGVRETCLIPPRDSRVLKAVCHIEEALGRKTSLEEIANKVGLSCSRLAHLFAEHTGRSVIAYERAVRLAVVRYLLESTPLLVEEIAWKLDVTPSYLTRMFRVPLGLSPRAYRLACRAGLTPRCGRSAQPRFGV